LFSGDFDFSGNPANAAVCKKWAEFIRSFHRRILQAYELNPQISSFISFVPFVSLEAGDAKHIVRATYDRVMSYRGMPQTRVLVLNRGTPLSISAIAQLARTQDDFSLVQVFGAVAQLVRATVWDCTA